jgi:hypothetical protein
MTRNRFDIRSLDCVHFSKKKFSKNWSTNSKNVKNKVKIQKLLLKIVFLEFLENNFSNNSRIFFLNFSRTLQEGIASLLLTLLT